VSPADVGIKTNTAVSHYFGVGEGERDNVEGTGLQYVEAGLGETEAHGLADWQAGVQRTAAPTGTVATCRCRDAFGVSATLSLSRSVPLAKSPLVSDKVSRGGAVVWTLVVEREREGGAIVDGFGDRRRDSSGGNDKDRDRAKGGATMSVPPTLACCQFVGAVLRVDAGKVAMWVVVLDDEEEAVRLVCVEYSHGSLHLCTTVLLPTIPSSLTPCPTGCLVSLADHLHFVPTDAALAQPPPLAVPPSLRITVLAFLPSPSLEDSNRFRLLAAKDDETWHTMVVEVRRGGDDEPPLTLAMVAPPVDTRIPAVAPATLSLDGSTVLATLAPSLCNGGQLHVDDSVKLGTTTWALIRHRLADASSASASPPTTGCLDLLHVVHACATVVPELSFSLPVAGGTSTRQVPLLLTATTTGSIAVHHFDTPTPHVDPSSSPPHSLCQPLYISRPADAHVGAVRCALDNGEGEFVTGGDDGTIRRWSMTRSAVSDEETTSASSTTAVAPQHLRLHRVSHTHPCALVAMFPVRPLGLVGSLDAQGGLALHEPGRLDLRHWFAPIWTNLPKAIIVLAKIGYIAFVKGGGDEQGNNTDGDDYVAVKEQKKKKKKEQQQQQQQQTPQGP